MLNSIAQKKAVVSLMLARIFYTVNWFNIPAIFIFIAVDFNEDISLLGLITASFFIGVGLFQVLAGILAAKYSPRKIAILGIAIASTAVFFSAFSIDLLSIAVLRFMVGLGMAFFFGPSVILISEYVGKQSEGLGMGLLNSAHAIGGIIGLFVWVIVAEFFGWRTSIVLSAIAGLITLVILQMWLPKIDEPRPNQGGDTRPDPNNEYKEKTQDIGSEIDVEQRRFSFKIKFGHVKDILLNKSLIKLGLVLLGVLQSQVYLIGISVVVAGFFLSWGFVIVYVKAKQVNTQSPPTYQTLSVSYVNGISLFGAFWIPILFAYIINQFGYSTAWIAGGAIFLALVLPILTLEE